MTKQEAVSRMTDTMAKFVAFTGKRLPDDVRQKIAELAAQEEEPLAKSIYQTMMRNQELAQKLNRPSCQDTGAIQFFLKCGSEFPYLGELPSLLREAVIRATKDAPLRHNAVETFDEYNTGKMWALAYRRCSGILYRGATIAKSTPIWRAAAAPCPARQKS